MIYANIFPILFIVVLYSGYLANTNTSKYPKWNGMVLYGIKGIVNYGKEGLWVPLVWEGMTPGSIGHLEGLVLGPWKIRIGFEKWGNLLHPSLALLPLPLLCRIRINMEWPTELRIITPIAALKWNEKQYK